MAAENQKENVPFAHYVQLFRQRDLTENPIVLPGTGFDGRNFHVQLMDRSYVIAHPAYSILPEPSLMVQTFLLRYLLESKNIPWLGNWKTFREMPWGENYEKAFSGRALTRAAFTFGHKPDAFRAACEKMGASPVKYGDAGYEFDFIGNYKIRIFIWAGDEEFPPSAQILYSDNFAEGFTAEDRAVAADLLIGAIKENM